MSKKKHFRTFATLRLDAAALIVSVSFYPKPIRENVVK